MAAKRAASITTTTKTFLDKLFSTCIRYPLKKSSCSALKSTIAKKDGYNLCHPTNEDALKSGKTLRTRKRPLTRKTASRLYGKSAGRRLSVLIPNSRQLFTAKLTEESIA